MTYPRDRNGFGAKTHNGQSFELVMVECPQCGNEFKIASDADWFRCMICFHEGNREDVECLD